MSSKDPRTLEGLVDEAKHSLKPESIDWDKVDGALFAKIEAENSGVRTSSVARLRIPQGEPNRARQVAGLLAAAAAIAFVLHRPVDRAVTSNGAGHAPESGAVTLTQNEGSTDVRIDGEIAAPGRALHDLDSIETTASRAQLSATDTRVTANDGIRASWMLDDHSRVSIKSLGGSGAPLVLELASGSVEAQVTPVPQGEAFAVDLRTPAGSAHDVVRIAVHGTHLRVTTNTIGTHAIVDLSEGVVSIGVPPKSGSTYGTLVSAPAHIDIDLARTAAGDTTGVAVDRNPAALRAPVVLASHAAATTITPSGAQAVAQNAESTPVEPADDHPGPHATQPAEKPAVTVDPHAEETVRAATQQCAVVHESSQEVRVTVSSKLVLQVGTDGLVKMARFEPPLSPEAQECAGKTIYKTHFAPAAAAHEVSIPIDVNP